jgi:hypothetical protein
MVEEEVDDDERAVPGLLLLALLPLFTISDFLVASTPTLERTVVLSSFVEELRFEKSGIVVIFFFLLVLVFFVCSYLSPVNHNLVIGCSDSRHCSGTTKNKNWRRSSYLSDGTKIFKSSLLSNGQISSIALVDSLYYCLHALSLGEE